jgi:hypothetical protein
MPGYNDLHIRFNTFNARHRQAADYLGSVKHKLKTALVTAAIEAYKEQHPHGVDYRELEDIQKASWIGFMPKAPIGKIQKLKPEISVIPRQTAPASPPEPPTTLGAGDKAIADSLSFYEIDVEDD